MSDECSPAGYHSLNLEEKVMVRVVVLMHSLWS